MPNPNFPSDGQGERIDAYVDASGTVYLKLAVANKSISGATNAGAWLGTATHADGATAGGSDGVVAVAGMAGTTVKHVLVDSSGRVITVGGAASGAALAGNPVLVAGGNGTNAYTLLTDTSGRLLVAGAAASGNAVAGNPVLMGGSDGANARTLTTDILGNQILAADYLTTFKTATATASGDTAVWTPASGKKFRLRQFLVEVTAEVAAAAPADLAIALRDATTAIGLTFSCYVPTSGGTVAGAAFSTGWVKLGAGYLSAAANNVLNVNLSGAITAGVVRVVAAGTEE